MPKPREQIREESSQAKKGRQATHLLPCYSFSSDDQEVFCCQTRSNQKTAKFTSTAYILIHPLFAQLFSLQQPENKQGKIFFSFFVKQWRSKDICKKKNGKFSIAILKTRARRGNQRSLKQPSSARRFACRTRRTSHPPPPG